MTKWRPWQYCFSPFRLYYTTTWLVVLKMVSTTTRAILDTRRYTNNKTENFSVSKKREHSIYVPLYHMHIAYKKAQTLQLAGSSQNPFLSKSLVQLYDTFLRVLCLFIFSSLRSSRALNVTFSFLSPFLSVFLWIIAYCVIFMSIASCVHVLFKCVYYSRVRVLFKCV